LTTLNKHLPAAIELLGQVLLEPRFDAADFERLKQRRLVSIDTRADNINRVTANVWQRLLYGERSIEGQPDAGTHETVAGMTLADVRSFYARSVVPDGSRLVFVGDMDAAAVHDLFAPLVARWKADHPSARPAAMARDASADAARARVLYWVDRPGAAQSQVRIGHLSVSSNDPDYVPLTVLNYILGGAFSSRINMNLREDKGYTYGARSSFSGGLEPGPFTASAGVHTAVTGASVKEFMRELNGILEGVTDAELAFAKDALTQQMATRFESSRALLGMLDNVAKFGWPDDYLEQRLRVIDALTAEDLRRLAKQYIRPEQAVVLVVGDGEQIAEQLGALDLGRPEELDIDGRPEQGR
jgi:zinc protease